MKYNDKFRRKKTNINIFNDYMYNFNLQNINVSHCKNG